MKNCHPQSEFRALRDPRFPVHKIADQLEPYLRVIVDQFHPDKIILFGSQAYGEPNEHSDVDLLIVRSGIVSENQSNLEIRRAFWSVPTTRPSFTILTKTPERIQQGLAEGSAFYEEISSKGVELYAAQTVER
jgi:uncharacterized protein